MVPVVTNSFHLWGQSRIKGRIQGHETANKLNSPHTPPSSFHSYGSAYCVPGRDWRHSPSASRLGGGGGSLQAAWCVRGRVVSAGCAGAPWQDC